MLEQGRQDSRGINIIIIRLLIQLVSKINIILSSIRFFYDSFPFYWSIVPKETSALISLTIKLSLDLD